MIVDKPIAVPLMSKEEQLEYDRKPQPSQEEIKKRMEKVIDTDDWNAE